MGQEPGRVSRLRIAMEVEIEMEFAGKGKSREPSGGAKPFSYSICHSQYQICPGLIGG